MNIRKIIAGLAAVASFTALAAGSANAQLVGFANAGGNNPAAGNYISYTPGNGGGFTLMTTNGFINENTLGITSPATINFGTLTNTPGSYIPPDPVTGAFSQGLSAGSFTITQGGTTLLSGTFGPSNLTGNDTSPGGAPGTSASGGIQLLSNSVTYTGGTYFDATKFSPDNGSLAITFKASGPIIATATQVDGFFANDAITFSAVPLGTPPGVPEPASVAGIGLGILFVFCLALFAKRRSTSMPV